jgi:hypothetical protein
VVAVVSLSAKMNMRIWLAAVRANDSSRWRGAWEVVWLRVMYYSRARAITDLAFFAGLRVVVHHGVFFGHLFEAELQLFSDECVHDAPVVPLYGNT